MAHLFPSHYHFVGHLGSHIQGSRKRYQRLHEPSAFHDRPDPLAFSRDPLSPSRGRQKPPARHLLCLRHRHSGGTGNILFFTSLTMGGRAAVVVPMTSLSPLATVILAFLVLREKISASQIVGLGLAFVAIYLLSL